MRTFLFAVLRLSVLSLGVSGCSSSVDPVKPDVAVHPTSVAVDRAPSRSVDRAIDLDAEPALGEIDPSQATDFFVWTHESQESEQRAVTHHLDAKGREIEKLDGIVIVTGAGRWQWRTEIRSIPVVACERYDDEGHDLAAEPVNPGTATRASLRHVASGAEQVVVEIGDDMVEDNEIEHEVKVLASLGPYLFIEQSTYSYGCGAHGNTDVSTLVWNAASGGPAGLPMDLESLRSLRARAIRELIDGEDDLFVPTEENVELTELAPKFSSDGTLELGVQFTAPTCFACTRGGWSSYTKSVIVGGAVVPEPLAPFARPPQPVRAFLRSHPDAALGGWSAR